MVDTPAFLKRAIVLQEELQKNSYPNAYVLAERLGCSRSTAMRTIERLRDEFGVPLSYDESRRGYYLTNPDFTFAALPPGRDELVALLLLSELASMIDDEGLKHSVASLWTMLTNGRAGVGYDLETFRSRFSSETTSVARLADADLVGLLTLCNSGQLVSLKYRSPWRHDEDKEYAGQFERLHFSDGILYALFHEAGGRALVLNVSFIKDITHIDTLPAIQQHERVSEKSSPFWLEGFGVWSGAKPQIIEVAIAAPASRYYAAQVWHPDQEDQWEGDILVRKFPGIPSPEVNRRILSLGRYVVRVQPESMYEQLAVDAGHLYQLTKG
jgi:predicted DNA-binding transcriptional regulator YafY